jgi:glycerol-3-phosphate dehydrogenase
MTRDFARLTDGTFDLLVLGGGIAGAAAAWDAAQRGLRVALVEANDFGSGTSWNSLKTIHGGLRHLQRLDIAGLRESVRERRALLRIAPSLVRPLPFIVPVRGRGARGRWAFEIAARLYGLLSLDRNAGVPTDRRLGPARMLSARELAALVPGLVADGALLWHDAQVDRAEALVLAFVRAAADHGAQVANRVEAVSVLKENGRIAGALVRDAVSGREGVVRATVVLAALGGGLDALLTRSGLAATGQAWLSAINLVLDVPAPTAVAIGGESGGRHVFLVPWRGRAMVGTDYAPRETSAAERVGALLDDALRAFPFLSCRARDVSLVHRGFVPGEHAAALCTRDRLVDHGTAGAPGLFSAMAAKYTTARALAERSVDRVFETLGRAPVRCRTASTLLPVLPDTGLSLEERVRRGIRDEMAAGLADIVQRRTDVGTAGRPAEDVLHTISDVMAAELHWSPEETDAQRRALLACYPDVE